MLNKKIRASGSTSLLIANVRLNEEPKMGAVERCSRI